MAELRANDLRFDHDETAARLGQSGLRLNAVKLAMLNALIEGWAAG
jgi:ATP/maltotriose-dependent transcriptional regulator MalT